DRVEDPGEGAERALEPAVPVGEEGARQGDREADAYCDQGQHDVLHERWAERVAPVLLHPVPAERVVVADAVAAAPEVRDHGAAAAGCQNRADHAAAPSPLPDSARVTSSTLT